MVSNDKENEQLELFPARFAFNLLLKREFPYFDETENELLVQRFDSNELVWSPKYLWKKVEKVKSEGLSQNEIKNEELVRVRIKDVDRYWSFNLTHSELQSLHNGELLIHWSSIKDVIRDVGDNVISAEVRGWCLVTLKQYALLLDQVNYNDNFDRLITEGGSAAWSEWSSVRWLGVDPWRQFRMVTRTPVCPPHAEKPRVIHSPLKRRLIKKLKERRNYRRE